MSATKQQILLNFLQNHGPAAMERFKQSVPLSAMVHYAFLTSAIQEAHRDGITDVETESVIATINETTNSTINVLLALSEVDIYGEPRDPAEVAGSREQLIEQASAMVAAGAHEPHVAEVYSLAQLAIDEGDLDASARRLLELLVILVEGTGVDVAIASEE